MIVIWSTRASSQRSEIFDYIADDNLKAAIRQDNYFSKLAGLLLDNPNLGKRGEIPETREILAKGTYRLVYEIHAEHILITTIVHTSREWPTISLANNVKT